MQSWLIVNPFLHMGGFLSAVVWGGSPQDLCGESGDVSSEDHPDHSDHSAWDADQDWVEIEAPSAGPGGKKKAHPR